MVHPPSLQGVSVASEPIGIQETIKFEDFELDPRAYELRRAGRVLKLERIPMDVLLFLVEQRGQLVTRDQIVERIWGKSVFLDTDNSINGAIRKIRQVLKDDPENPRFVQTVTAKGYRFIAPAIDDVVSHLATDTVSERPTVSESMPGAENSDTHIPRVRPFRQRLILMGIFMVVIAAVGVYVVRSRSEAQIPPSGGRLMLAVLPFENLTGDAGQDYFSDGLTEEMITQLGRIDAQRMGVIARTSVMHYKHTQEQLDQIGRELGVQYVLEGSVRRDSNNVRITAQLIQVKDQTHLWAQEYDRDLKDLLVVQGEIARRIADEIQAALGEHKGITSPSQVSISPQAYEAYDLYLKGEYFWNKRTAEDFQRAIDYFQQAIAIDPNYARAYAGLADSYALIGGYAMAPQTEFEPKARAAALRAVELDDKLPEAHTALALIVQNYDWDWQTAEKEFRRAIELNPNYATAHHWYAEHLMWLGHFDEALHESERARQLDPLSLIIATDNGAILYYSRQYDRAIEKFNAVHEMDPSFPHASMIVKAYDQKGMFAESLAATEYGRRTYGDGPWISSEQAYIYGLMGQQAGARPLLVKLEQWNRRYPLDPSVFVAPYIAIGDKDRALLWLEKAYAQHSNAMTGLKVDPIYDPLRSDPRFKDLLRRVGLVP
jgi:TolB-like protein/DNA-binding winged helix-turn-helix (wHTH) protein